MTTVSLGFDITALTKGEISAAQKSERIPLQAVASEAWSSLRSGVGSFISAFGGGFAKSIADYALASVEKRTNAMAKHAIWFEGAKDIMIKEMALTAKPPSKELLEPLAVLQEMNGESIRKCEELILSLRTANPDSRVASAFERLETVILRLDASLSEIKQITLEGLAHASVLGGIHELHSSIDSKIAHYVDDDVEFDPELVALADQALERISSQAKTSKIS